MSTRMTKSATDSASIATGLEGNNIPDDLVLPSCTIEDVDRSIFNLFNNDLPLFAMNKSSTSRIPVIFATGERFAVLRRKQPLRDKAGALILPLVSIMRTSISQQAAPGLGPGQNGPITIKKRLDKKDPKFQNLLNKLGLLNQDDVAAESHKTYTSNENPGTAPGQVATRNAKSAQTTAARRGRLLTPDLGSNIFEIITMPPVKHYAATYEVTFWAQYTQQMNDMIMAVMSTYQNNHAKSFRLETEKGYWFCAYVASDLTPGNNHDDFTDNERLVRYSFEVNVPAYIIAPQYPGAPAPLRKFISAPTIAFETQQTYGTPVYRAKGGVPSGDPDSYILQDLFDLDDPPPGSGVASAGVTNTLAAAAGINHSHENIGWTGASSDSSQINSDGSSASTQGEVNSTIGGYSAGPQDVRFVRIDKDPFTGKATKKLVKIKDQNQRKGETVYREGLVKNLETLD